MNIIKTQNYEEMSKRAADIIAAQIILKSNSVLGLATGSSPEGLYSELIKKFNSNEISFKNIQTFNLDEYKGLAPDHDQSYRFFMNEHLFNHVDILPENTYIPDGLKSDADSECSKYENLIDSVGGIDIQLLGLGLNGHVGFNEPDTSFVLNTHCVELTASTLEANSRFFDNDIKKMPHYAYTMGIGTIMKAKKILLIVSGSKKAEILYKSLTGPITPQVPASILQLHKDVVVVADEAALKYFN